MEWNLRLILGLGFRVLLSPTLPVFSLAMPIVVTIRVPRPSIN